MAIELKPGIALTVPQRSCRRQLAALSMTMLLVACGSEQSAERAQPSNGQVAPLTTAPKVSFYAASRFAEQASFGPTPALVAELQTKGFEKWIDEQFAMPATPLDMRFIGVCLAKSKASKVDGIVLESPRQFHSVFPSPIPPNSPKYHLRLPGDLATALGAQAARQKGFRGEGVSVAMPDSGWYRHPYFTANGYKIKKPLVAIPGTNPSKDPVGHGTGESANIFAIAPGAVLQPLRATDANGKFFGAVTAFLKAKALAPRIMTNSWGGDSFYPPFAGPDAGDLAWAAEILDAVENGILVIFSAGNGQFSVEPQVPGVLSAGGAFLDSNGQLHASSYASGYRSPWFNQEIVPTVCGLVGMQPRAQYLMLPVQPGCELDREESAFASAEAGDGTTATDGWALFSGTSAAAPQIAGAAALILGAKPALRPAQVIEALSKTAVDVRNGRSFPQVFNEPAGPGRDNATGWGLINASAAVEYALAKF